MDGFWKYYLRVLACVAGAGLLLLFFAVVMGDEKMSWSSPQTVALITVLLGSIVPITTAVWNWAKLRLEEQQSKAKLAIEHQQQQQGMTNDYLKLALDPARSSAERQLVLRFLEAQGTGEDKLRTWAAEEGRRNVMVVIAETQSLKARRDRSADHDERMELERLIAVNTRALPPPPGAPFSIENLKAGIVNGNIGPQDLSKTNLDGLSFYSGRFSDCSFRGSVMRHAALDDGESRNSDFSGSDLSGTSLGSSILTGCRFEKARLVAVNFRRSDLRMSTFAGADLAGANFEQCHLQGVDFRGATVQGHKKGADTFEHSKTSSCKPTNPATFTGARYDERTRWPEGFDPIKEGCFLVPDLSLAV